MHIPIAPIRRYILFVVFATILVSISNFKWGSVYVGLDNISPFWGFNTIVSQIEHSQNYFTYGPILFSWWFGLFYILGLSASAISFIYVWFYFALSCFGYDLLLRKLITKHSSKYSPVTILVLLSSLTSLWVFSTHQLMFMSLFVALPFAIYYLVSPPSKISELIFVSIVILPLFYTSSINLSTFFFGSLFILYYALLLKGEGVSSRAILLRWSVIMTFFCMLSQLLVFATRGPVFLGTELQAHAQMIQKSRDTTTIREDLFQSEKAEASITSSLRFLSGWIDISFPNNQSVFTWEQIYKKSYFIASIQLAVILIAVIVSYRAKKIAGGLYVSLVLWVLIMSPLTLSLLNSIPLLRDLLRSTSTKLWPLFFIPYLTFITGALTHLVTDRKILLSILSGVAILIIGYPWYNGTVFGTATITSLPREYETWYSGLGKDDTVLILPNPELLYFRQYEWGYYGSDFVSYMSQAKIYNAGSITTQDQSYSIAAFCTQPQEYLLRTRYVVIEESTGIDCPANQYLQSQNSYFKVYTLPR